MSEQHRTRKGTSHRARAGRVTLAVALATGLVVTALATASPAAPRPTAGADPGGGDAGAVCGSLRADTRFAVEASHLGVAHACEHLRVRRSPPPLTSAAGVRHEHGTAAAPATAALASSVTGSWSSAIEPDTDAVGISAVLLHTGRVLLIGGYSSNDRTPAYLFDPVTGTGHDVTAPAAVFCASVTQLSDGRVLTAGGADPVPRGIRDLWIFDPATHRWVRQPDTPLGRYYPTSTKLADGRLMIAGGRQVDGSTQNPKVELYTPPAPGVPAGQLQVVGPDHVSGSYPRQWLMPDGHVLQVNGRRSWRFTTGSWTWTSLRQLPTTNGAGSAGLMLPAGPGGSQRVMMIGGLLTDSASRATQHFDYGNVAAGWRLGNQMPTTRTHMNVVQVPDGSAFGIGGNGSKQFLQPRTQTMHYTPATDTWTDMAVQGRRRGYHSTAILLPDGRIMSAGDNGRGGGNEEIDFYSPPYLFKGPRPEITSAPGQVDHGSTFEISTSGPAVSRAVLMAPGATTHTNEMHARHVELAVNPTATGLTATVGTPTPTPPGHYMLFALTADGIPSVARWVHVGP